MADDDPLGAWESLSGGIQAALDSGAGGGGLAAAVDLYCIGDVLIHTWDLARATGLDDALDADEVHRQRGARGRA